MREAPPAHGAILLAAGASTRLGTAKQLIEIDGVSLLRRAAEALLATAPRVLVVVLGHEAAAMRAALFPIDAHVVCAHDHAEGLSASLRAGIAALPSDLGGTLVALTDQPALDAAHLSALCARWQRAPMRAVASAYAGVLGVPALLPRNWFADLARLRGDVGARGLLRERADDVVAVDAPALAHDIDTSRDLE